MVPRPRTSFHSECQPGTPRVRSRWSRASRRHSVAATTASVDSIASSMESSTAAMARCSGRGGRRTGREETSPLVIPWIVVPRDLLCNSGASFTKALHKYSESTRPFASRQVMSWLAPMVSIAIPARPTAVLVATNNDPGLQTTVPPEWRPSAVRKERALSFRIRNLVRSAPVTKGICPLQYSGRFLRGVPP